MTESESEAQTDQQPEPQDETQAVNGAVAESEDAGGPATVNCRHCGQPAEVDAVANPDWQCSNCERYQDAMMCPTCHQTARISLMPAEMAPAIHSPARRRKKEQ